MKPIKHADQTDLFGGQSVTVLDTRRRAPARASMPRREAQPLGAALRRVPDILPGWGVQNAPEALPERLTDSAVKPPSAEELLNTADYALSHYRLVRSTALWLAGLRPHEREERANNLTSAFEVFERARALAERHKTVLTVLNHDARAVPCLCVGCLFDQLQREYDLILDK